MRTVPEYRALAELSMAELLLMAVVVGWVLLAHRPLDSVAAVFLLVFLLTRFLRALLFNALVSLRLRQEAGPFSITVFTAPEPLAAGPADVSVLVQDRRTGAVLLDASVEIALAGPAGVAPLVVEAGPGTNRLLKSAAIAFDRPGTWRLEVVVRRAEETQRVACPLPVAPPASPLGSAWPFLAFPPVAVALFALRGAIRRRRS